MGVILAVLCIALAQPPAATSVDARGAQSEKAASAVGVRYIEGPSSADRPFRFVGVDRLVSLVSGSARSVAGDAALKAAGSSDEARRIIGPLAISSDSPAAIAWAVTVRVPLPQDAAMASLVLREGAACGGAAEPLPVGQAPAGRAGGSDENAVAELTQGAVVAAGLHDRAIRGLAIAAAIDELRAGESSPANGAAAGQLPALEAAAGAWLAQPEPQRSIAPLVPLDAMGLVATIEYWDARHSLLGALSKPKDAALARETLRWHLNRLGATRLLGLLDERVPPVGTGFLALTACPSWPYDAWEIVEAELRLRGERDELRSRLHEASESAARRFDEEYAAMLRNAMGFVEDALPPGLKVDSRLLREIEEHLSRALDEDTVVRADMGPEAVALARNDGNAELTTRAWEVWGRLLATGGLPPAEAALRRSQIEGWHEMAAQRALRWDTTGRVAQDGLDAMAGAFDALMSDPWSGWAFRAMPESVYERAMRKARGSLSLALEGTPSGDENGLRDALRISAWETHLELQRAGLGGGELRSLTPFPKDRTLDAGHGMAVSNAPARRRLMLDPVGMYPPGNAPTPR